jgi:CrcB protein
MLTKILMVGLGGFIGASLRYVSGLVVGRFTSQTPFPFETFVVNMLGCLLIGFLAGLADTRNLFSETARVFVFTGFLGAFTTFSTFSHDTVGLFQNGLPTQALMNMGVQIFLGLIAVLGGLQISRFL